MMFIPGEIFKLKAPPFPANANISHIWSLWRNGSSVESKVKFEQCLAAQFEFLKANWVTKHPYRQSEPSQKLKFVCN